MIGDNAASALRLADELFLIAHDDFSGKPKSAANLLDTALAGAALAELVLDNRLMVDGNGVTVLDGQLRQEPVTDLILSEIMSRGNGHPARLWLVYLRDQQQICERVGNRLVSKGWVRRVESRSLSLRMSVRWPGVDPNRAAAPRVRLAGALQRVDKPLEPYAAMLAALSRAGGLTRVLSLLDSSVVERIDATRRMLPPPLRALLSAVDATVAASAVSVRR